MRKTQAQRKGVFCLEGHWKGIKDKSTVEPVLRLLGGLSDYQTLYRHYNVGTREELDFYLTKWCGTFFDDYPILYLAFHGDKGKLFVGERRDSALSLEDVAARLNGSCKGRVVHLGTCSTVGVHGRDLNKFLARTEALAVCGFTKEVDMLESAAFETLLFGSRQYASFRQSASMRKFDEELRKTASGLYRRLGYRRWYMD